MTDIGPIREIIRVEPLEDPFTPAAPIGPEPQPVAPDPERKPEKVPAGA
jgi:hypothetical protein